MNQFSLAFPEDRRFDDRALRTADDGADFEDFVFDLFDLDGPTLCLPQDFLSWLRRCFRPGGRRLGSRYSTTGAAQAGPGGVRKTRLSQELGKRLQALKWLPRFVVHRILEQGGVPDPAAVSTACDGLPVLAAFAVFLYQRARESFSAQFGDLIGVPDFHTWAERRITILCQAAGSAVTAERILAGFALRGHP